MGTDPALIQQLEKVAIGLVGITALALRESATRPELTLLQWRALLLIGGSPEPLRIGDLARRLPASPSSATRVVERLSHRGLVTSLRRTVDGRGVWLEVTPTGQTEYQAVSERRRELLREAVMPLADVERDVDGALAVLADLMGSWPGTTSVGGR